jgi:hypothetical protein
MEAADCLRPIKGSTPPPNPKIPSVPHFSLCSLSITGNCRHSSFGQRHREHPGAPGVVEEVCRAANSNTEEEIKEGRLQSPANHSSPLQMLARIGEIELVSIDNRRRGPSRKILGELALLLGILLHLSVVCSSS